MRADIERALRVKSLSHDILGQMMEDRTTFKEADLRNVIELLSRSINELVDIYIDNDDDHSTTLKGTIAKLRIGYNTIYFGKEKQSMENESV